MRNGILPAVLLAVLSSGFQVVGAQQPGEQVIVVRQAPLHVGPNVLETLPQGLPVRVGQVQGDWLAVANRRSGWVHRQHVLPLPEAIEHFSAILTRNGKDEAAYVIRGVLWQTSGDYDRAIADFTAVLRLNASNRPAYCNRAIAWKQKGEYELALGDYNEAIRLDPHAAMTWHNRGAVWAAQEKFARAAADFREAIRLDPQLPDAYNALAWVQATCSDPSIRNSQTALDNARRACELSGYGRWSFMCTLAAAHAEAGNFQQAIHWAQKCLARAPDDRHAELQQRLELFQAGLPYRQSDYARRVTRSVW